MSLTALIRRGGGSEASSNARPEKKRRDETLTNTPPVVDDTTKRMFSELYGNPQATAAKLALLLGIAVAAILVQSFALVSLIPLHKPVPFIIEKNDAGVVARVVKASDFRPDKNMIKASLNAWLEKMLVIDPYKTQESHRLALAMVRGNAVSEHTAWLQKEHPYARLAENPTLTRVVDEDRQIDVSKDGIAFAFITTTERTAKEPKPRKQQWRLTIHYGIQPPESDAEILSNPVGVQITHFEFLEVNQ